MLERIGGIAVLAGLIISVAGSVIENQDLKITGVLILLITATVAGYRFLKFQLTTPSTDFVGICIERKRLSSYYVLSFRTGGEIYSGRASLKMGEGVKIGERVRLKVKGPVILEIDKT
ncbi:MAG TPA: hypothetical protein GXZ25_00505 [Peptococcaceae bacterium]|nr:hypothetical protein [Bacillota bacterium]HHU85278.1 hypothetical protein [Peptococcaceae bacterium]